MRTLLHVTSETTLDYVRQLKRRKRNQLKAAVRSYNQDDSRNETDSSVSNESSDGYDYTDYNAPVSAHYDLISDRLNNYDTYFGKPTRMKFLETQAKGGHTHDGTNGNGPKIPGTSVVSSDGGTLSDHMNDMEAHSVANSQSARPAGFFDGFETLSSDNWQVVSGSVSLATLANSTKALQLEAGTRLRLLAGGSSWKDRLTAEFNLAITDTVSTDRYFDLEMRCGASGTRAIFRIQSSGLGSTTYDRNEITEDENHTALGYVICPNDGAMHTHRCMLYDTEGYFWTKLEASPERQTCTTASSTNQGYIEVYAACTCILDTFVVVRNLRQDFLDTVDSSGRWYAGTPKSLHAATHAVGGGDTLDVKYLADSYGVLLTLDEKAALLPGGTMHKHTDDAVVLGAYPDGYPVLGGHTSLRAHVQDINLHRTGQSIVLRHPPAVSIPKTAEDYVGTSAYAARADHFHALPHWLVDSTEWTPGADHVCDDTCFDGQSTLTHPIRIESADGSFFSAKDGVGMVSSYNKCQHYRARLRLFNAGSGNVTKRLHFSIVTGSIAIDHAYLVDGARISYRIATHTETYDTDWDVDVELRPDLNDLSIYIYFPYLKMTNANDYGRRVISVGVVDGSGYPETLYDSLARVYFVGMPTKAQLGWWSSFPGGYLAPE